MLLAATLVLGLDMGHVGIARARGHELLAHPDCARGILHVNDRAFVLRVDFHGRVRRRSRGSADEQGLFVPQPLHLLRHVHHFIQRWRDESGQSDEIGAFARGRLQNLLAGGHHAQIHHLEVVTLQNHADDVLADIVDVALHRRHDHLTVGAACAGLFPFDIRDQHRHGFFHDSRRFDDLRQEHLPGAEQIADHVHPVH